MKKLPLFLFIFFSIFSFAQVTVYQSTSNEKQKKLIAEFIKVSGFNDSIFLISENIVKDKTIKSENGKIIQILNSEERFKILEGIWNKYLNPENSYTFFMNLTEKDLENLITFYKENPNFKSNSFLFASNLVFSKLIDEINIEINKILKEKNK